MSALAAYAPISTRAWFVHDTPSERTESQKDIDFHVEHGDYFAALATILGLFEDALRSSIETGTAPSEFYLEKLRALKNDLMYLHREYRIVRKQ